MNWTFCVSVGQWAHSDNQTAQRMVSFVNGLGWKRWQNEARIFQTNCDAVSLCGYLSISFLQCGVHIVWWRACFWWWPHKWHPNPFYLFVKISLPARAAVYTQSCHHKHIILKRTVNSSKHFKYRRIQWAQLDFCDITLNNTTLIYHLTRQNHRRAYTNQFSALCVFFDISSRTVECGAIFPSWCWPEREQHKENRPWLLVLSMP